MKKILSRMRQAVERYGMILPGDKIAVGVSGGKDSLVLLAALVYMSRFEDYSYTVEAVTVDNGMADGRRADFSEVSAFCEELGVKHHIITTDIYEIVFDRREEKNPCSLCATLRRGALIDTALKLGCTSVALGHNLDDAAETYMMNILLAGRAGSFLPVMTYENTNLKMVRPLVYLREGDIASCAKRNSFPIMEKICPVDGETEREHFKELLLDEDKRHRGVYTRILGVLERTEWKELIIKV